MKKLIAIILAAAVMLCGCSLFGEENGGLSEKLSGMEHADSAQRTKEPAAEALPESLSFEQLDPYDMLHNGWSFTQEKARAEYGMEPLEEVEEYMSVELAQLLPGMSYGSAWGMWSYTSNGMHIGAVGEYEYQYSFNYSISTEDAAQVFRLAFEAADEQFGGRNKSWDNEKFNNFESLSNLEFADLLFHDEDSSASDATGCSWGFYADDGSPGIFTIILRASEEKIDQLVIYIDFGTGRTQASSYFPDDKAEREVSSASSHFPDETAEKEVPEAMPEQSSSSATANAADMVRIGTYANEDVFGVGLVWSITFYADHTFEFSYDHEEGTEYFTGNWHSEGDGSRVVLDITSGVPFTTYLYVDGHKYVIFEDEGFSNVSLPFVG